MLPFDGRVRVPQPDGSIAYLEWSKDAFDISFEIPDFTWKVRPQTS